MISKLINKEHTRFILLFLINPKKNAELVYKWNRKTHHKCKTGKTYRCEDKKNVNVVHFHQKQRKGSKTQFPFSWKLLVPSDRLFLSIFHILSPWYTSTITKMWKYELMMASSHKKYYCAYFLGGHSQFIKKIGKYFYIATCRIWIIFYVPSH